MSLVSGYLIACERCGKTEFRPSEIRSNRVDFVNSTINTRILINDPDWVNYDKIGYLCKECSKKFDELLESFMNYEP